MIVTYRGRLGIVRRGKRKLVIEWFGGGKSTLDARKVTIVNRDDVAGFEHCVQFFN